MEKIHLGTFSVAGISVRTTNVNGQSQNDIGRLWEKFIGEKISDTIQHKLSPDIYCVYTDYESDDKGPYTTFLGCQVDSSDEVQEGLDIISIPASTFLVLTSHGKIPEAVVQTWNEIWQSGIQRKYLADFDVYGERSADLENAEVKTYISV